MSLHHLARIERVAQSVADEVDRQYGEEDRRAGKQRPVRRDVEVVLGVEQQPVGRVFEGAGQFQVGTLPAVRLVGSEIFCQGLNFAAQRLPKVELIQMDARNIPYLSEFDVIGTFDVLEHIVEDHTVLREIHKALVPGGGMLVTVPQHRFLWSAADESAHHVRRYAAKELREKVEHAGFDVLRMTSFVSFLLPLMLASRLRKRKNSPDEATSELTLPPFLDHLFEIVMRMEIALIRAGVNFPAGGSLLLIARKPD